MKFLAYALFTIICFFIVKTADSQSIRVGGFVTESGRGESLSDVTIISGRHTVISNKSGYYSLRVNKLATITFTSIGFDPVTVVVGEVDTLINVTLNEAVVDLGEATVSLKRTTPDLGVVSISPQRIKEIPALFGEPDVIKAFSFTPGVTMSNEASVGFIVRGGAPDQNLVLLDDTPVYNLAHLFGFTSIFNPDAIKSATLYKGYFPAKYGGRLSSILDVTLHEGNDKRIKQELSVGLISSRYSIDGPMKIRGKIGTTFSVSARSSYLTLFLFPAKISFNKGKQDQYFNYWLYDLSAKVKHNFSEKSYLSIGFYTGRDFWNTLSGEPDSRSGSNLNWGNLTFSAKHTQLFSQKIFLTSQLLYTQYGHHINLEERTKNKQSFVDINSGIQDFAVKLGMEIYPSNQHNLNVGIDLVRHNFSPSFIKSSISLESVNNESIKANEIAFYVTDNLRIARNISVNLGLRAVNYKVLESDYTRIEPRVELSYRFLRHLSLKTSFGRANQFVHQLSSNSLGLPVDIWIPSTSNINPQSSDQAALGITKEYKEEGISLSIEGYYKTFKNLIDYQTGTSILTNFDESWEKTIELDGVGKSHGVEAMLKKNTPLFSLWVSYSYSVSKRKFETSNNNQWFFAPYDRRHVFTSTATYNWLNGKGAFSANWVVYSGAPTTVPSGVAKSYVRGELKNYPYLIYSERNNFRYPMYHRLDLGLSFNKKTRYHKDRVITLGIYNVYNRANPFYLELKPVYLNGKLDHLKFIQVGILPVLPYLSYSLKW